MDNELKPFATTTHSLIHIYSSLLSLSESNRIFLEVSMTDLWWKVTWFVTCTRNNALTKTASAWPSLKYSFNVVLNFFEYFTNSFFLCSTACFPEDPGMNPTTSFTASSSFLMALAISLKTIFRLTSNRCLCKVKLTLLFPGKSCDRWSRQGFC